VKRDASPLHRPAALKKRARQVRALQHRGALLAWNLAKERRRIVRLEAPTVMLTFLEAKPMNCTAACPKGIERA